MAPTPTRIEADDALAPTYTIEETELLARNLRALLEEVHRGEHRERELTVHYLCELHGNLFSGVRDHAGRHRERGRGSER